MTFIRCESRYVLGGQCRAQSAWRVSVGTRRSDAQYSCRRHLDRTCEALLGAEERRSALLTVAPVT